MKVTFSHEPKLPPNYALIYEIVRRAGRGVHLTMNDVYAQAKRRRPTIGFSTVYRGIARLRDEGCIDEIEVPGSDCAVYELTGTPHAHFRCDRCGSVQDVPYRLPARTLRGLAAKIGARIEQSTVTLHGRCRPCVKAS
ncbi:MAG TPA: transcriptional repressor [Candidatus Tyrphobacter sp.]